MWEWNLEEEMKVIRGLVGKYPYVAMVRRGSAPRSTEVVSCSIPPPLGRSYRLLRVRMDPHMEWCILHVIFNRTLSSRGW